VTYRADLLILSQLRHAEQIERDELVRFKLRTTAEEMDVSLRLFAVAPSGQNLAALQGIWACAVRVLGNAGGSRHLHPQPT
jgi:hypothetical protein